MNYSFSHLITVTNTNSYKQTSHKLIQLDFLSLYGFSAEKLASSHLDTFWTIEGYLVINRSHQEIIFFPQFDLLSALVRHTALCLVNILVQCPYLLLYNTSNKHKRHQSKSSKCLFLPRCINVSYLPSNYFNYSC